MRLVLLTAVLSKVIVPPVSMVMAGLPAVVVETEPSAMFADAVSPEVLIAMSGGEVPARAPWNVIWKIWLLAPLLASAVTATLAAARLIGLASRAARMLAAVVAGVV